MISGDFIAAAHTVVDEILVVDDDPVAIRLLGKVLAGAGNLRFATSGEAALNLVREKLPDLILLDADMPRMTGFEVLEALNTQPELAKISVIFVTSHDDAEFEVSGFALGASDFISKPFNPDRLMSRVQAQLRLKHTADELRHLSTTDSLTGIANRRHFDDALEREWRRCRRAGDAMGLLIVDVDHFKRFNDLYGHPAGDVCLRAIAQALQTICARPADVLARWGGEEFALLLPQTPRVGAEQVAHNILDAVEALEIVHDASPTAWHVTVSVGVSCFDEESANWMPASADSRFGEGSRLRCTAAILEQAADVALYCAKRAGRAQALLLDAADVGNSAMARAISPVHSTSGVAP